MASPLRPLPRILARGLPAADPDCAGCAQLGLFRALRRCGLEVQGGSGCGPAERGPLRPAPGRFAAVSGARQAAASAAALLRDAQAAGARLVAIADRDGPGARDAAAALAAAGVPVITIAPTLPAARAEDLARSALASGAALVLLSPCAREAPRAPPFAVNPARCNRCGACLGLACPALSDGGGEAMGIEPALCNGCGSCAPLCRAGAIRASP